MTIFGPDFSSYQAGIDVTALPHPFVIAKVTQGTWYTDGSYDAFRRQAASSGKTFVWYHFLSGEDAHDQALHTLAQVGDKSLPGMLDVEPAGSYTPSLEQALAYIDAAHSLGLNLRLMYLPEWVHAEIGKPSLTGLTSRRVGLVSSSYPGGHVYPGDDANGWDSYGGLEPVLYQYTNVAPVQTRWSVDMNAFRGTLEQFLTTLGADPMGTIPASIGQKWSEIASEFPANGQFADDTALIWADAGARAAALYAKEARDAITALAAKIQQPPAVDVTALAAAIAPHLEAGASADTIASAVLRHLSAATSSA